MFPEQRTAFDQLVTHMRRGRMTRRTFLERALAVGLTSVAATSLLESCSGSDSTIYLVWQSEFDITTAYHDVVDTFNKTNKDGIYVTMQSVETGTSELPPIERNMLKVHSTAVDIFSIDIISVAEFAYQRWITPISESQWPTSERAKYLPVPLEACTFNEQIWAAPYRADVGLLYYRTDLVDSPPARWEELTPISRSVLAKPHPSALRYGYVWEGSQYEGLVCNFDEVLRGYGGSILDPTNPTRVTVNSTEAIQALTTMVNWIKTISPADTNTYTEEVARKTWEGGQAIFMRNWPYVYADAQKTLIGKFAIHPMLYGGQNTVGHSSLGGWQLAINAFIDPDKQAAAWKFIQYMLGEQAQKTGALTASWLVTLKSIYEDPEVLSKVPLFKEIGPILQTAGLRPLIPRYTDVSQAIRFRVRQALDGMPVREALRNLAADLEPLVKQQ